MTDALEKVPAETRWTIATQALTGAVTATGKALLDVVGQEKYNEIERQIWSEGGKAAKQIADAFGLAGNDAKSAAETVELVATVMMGPELKVETVEATAEKTVVRATECPWWNRAKELGISDFDCSVGDSAWCNGLAKSLNPKVTVSLTKAMPRGDSYCEWVYKLQK
jgi:predicted ArsR family transcriptional regulator